MKRTSLVLSFLCISPAIFCLSHEGRMTSLERAIASKSKFQRDALKRNKMLVASNPPGLTLQSAIFYNNLWRIHLCLSAGADANATWQGLSMAQWASVHHNSAILAKLIEYGADINMHAGGTKSCLALACKYARVDNVRLLINASARYRSAKSRKTPLQEIAKNISDKTQKAHVECADLVIKSFGKEESLYSPKPEWFYLYSESLATFNRIVHGKSGELTPSQQALKDLIAKHRQPPTRKLPHGVMRMIIGID